MKEKLLMPQRSQFGEQESRVASFYVPTISPMPAFF